MAIHSPTGDSASPSGTAEAFRHKRCDVILRGRDDAAGLLGVMPAQAAVIAAAMAGIWFGRAGGFGLVVGLKRGKPAQMLRRNWTDLLVSDPGESAAGTEGGQP